MMRPEDDTTQRDDGGIRVHETKRDTRHFALIESSSSSRLIRHKPSLCFVSGDRNTRKESSCGTLKNETSDTMDDDGRRGAFDPDDAMAIPMCKIKIA